MAVSTGDDPIRKRVNCLFWCARLTDASNPSRPVDCGTEAVHRALARFAQGEIGGEAIVPNDVGFENFDWPTIGAVRTALEDLGIGYGTETSQPGRFYEYPGDPLESGVGKPVSHSKPA